MFTKDLLKNKRILITGGGTGLGKEMASHFAEYGADIYICGRRDNVLQDTAEEIKEKFNKPTIIITTDGKNGKGSARSIVGFDIGSVILAAVHKKILIKVHQSA